VKIFIHIGYAKCGSTSLQEALRDGSGVLFPRAGTNVPAAEHISLPLFLKGIDEYTRQYISDEWVQDNHARMMEEIAQSKQPVFLSSERLASLQGPEIEALKGLFAEHDVEIIIIVRNKEKYLDSTWRHAVFYHDYAVDFQAFQQKMARFEFGSIIPAFQKYFPIHLFNLDDENFERGIKELTGAQFAFGKANIGVPHKLAELLQQQHALIGSALFKEIFPTKVKKKMLFMMTETAPPAVDPFNVPLF